MSGDRRPAGSDLSPAQGKAALAAEEARRAGLDRRGRPSRMPPMPPARTSRPGQLDNPEAIILFARVPAGIRLYASRDLPDIDGGTSFSVIMDENALTTADAHWKLGAVMDDMLIITKPTLPEALAELQRIWAARDRAAGEGRPSLPAGRKAIGA